MVPFHLHSTAVIGNHGENALIVDLHSQLAKDFSTFSDNLGDQVVVQQP